MEEVGAAVWGAVCRPIVGIPALGGGRGRRAGRTHGRIYGLAWRPGELQVGILAFRRGVLGRCLVLFVGVHASRGGRRPGELLVGIPAFGKGWLRGELDLFISTFRGGKMAGRTHGRIHGLGRRPGSCMKGFLHLEEAVWGGDVGSYI